MRIISVPEIKFSFPMYPAVNDARIETLKQFGAEPFQVFTDHELEMAARFDVSVALEKALKARELMVVDFRKEKK